MRAPALASALLVAPFLVASFVVAPPTFGAVGTAVADGFDDKVKAARPIHDAKSMTALFWSQGADCTAAKNDLLRRQCEGVRTERKRRVASETYVVDVGVEAFDIAADAKKMSVQVNLRSCLWCGTEGPVVIGKGVHTVEAGSVKAAVVGGGSKTFKKGGMAQHWAAHIATRMKAQMLVKVPAALETFKAGGRNGYKVDVVGYRLYDPCQGDVVAASPKSEKGPIVASSCKDAPAYTGDPNVVKVPEIVHPDRLSTAQIKTSMADVLVQAKACYDAYGIEGMATFKMIIAGSGKLAKAEQLGDFTGTPTGICLDKAMQAASFPKSKKKATPITYPIVLR